MGTNCLIKKPAMDLKRLILNLPLVIFFVLAAVFLPGCSKSSAGKNTNDSTVTTPPKPLSLTDQISGTYSGNGKKIPQAVNLGRFTGCVVPTGWENNLVSGAGSVDISKFGDSSVHLVFSGGPFSASDAYNLNITKSGNSIILPPNYPIPGVALSYDINTKNLSVAVNTASSYYVPPSSCTQGLPYYYGAPSIPFDGSYVYLSIGHIEFSGTKN